MRAPSQVLVGRDDLLALADRRLTATAAGRGELLFLAGEAGIGKTRLLTEIAARAAARGFRVVTAAAFPADADVAAGLITDALSSFGTTTAELLRQPLDGDTHRQRRLLVTGLADALAAAGAGPEPVLITLEDLHWADDVTLQTLARLAHRLAGLPLLIIGSYRSDELYPRVPMREWRTRLLNQRHAEEARLARLSPGETAALAAAISGTLLPATVTSAIFERSDGIPLHIEEFLAGITTAALPGTSTGAASALPGPPSSAAPALSGPPSGVAPASPGPPSSAALAQPGRPTRGAPALSGVPASAAPVLPDTLAEAVLARAASLSAPARSLAGAASVIGRSFGVDLLIAITGEGPDRIDDGLRELAERFFVRPHPDGSTYDFRHALIRDALHADLPPLRRRELHARAAEAARAAGFPDAFVSDQYERAHLPAEAHAHAVTAAVAAVRISAHREAVELYRRALRTAPAGLPGAERATLLAALGAELAAVDENASAAEMLLCAYKMRLELGDALSAAGLVPQLAAVRHLLGAGLGERTELLREGLELITDRTDDRAQEIRAGLHAALAAAYMLDRRLEEATEVGVLAEAFSVEDCDHPLRCQLGGTLGSILVFAGRMHEGWQMLANAIGRARRGGLEAEAARGYRMLGSSASVLVEYDLARHWLAEGIGYAESVERFNDRHYMAAHLAHVDWAEGAWEAAERGATRALADGQGITTRITALHVLGYVALGQGRWDAAAECLREAATLGEAMGELQRTSPAWWGLASLALLQDDPATAIGWCERGYAASARVRDAAYLFPYVVTGVRAYLATRNLTGAREWLARTTSLLADREIPGTLGAIDHGAGLVLLHEGQTGKARVSLERAAAFWRERRRFWEGTQAELDQARCATRSRRPADAARLSAQAAAHASAAGAVVLLPAVHLSVSHPLTARELEIANRVAEGATNREIATALSIAPKTVSAHVEHILTKLAVSRRAQIATWATTQKRTPSTERGTSNGL